MELSYRKTLPEYKKIISGKNCRLKKFEKNDGKLAELIYKIFTDKELIEFINPDYLSNDTKSKVRKWADKKAGAEYEAWYTIIYKGTYIGYVCFKWKEHFDSVCEISTAILPEYRGLKLGYESSKLIIDYVRSLKNFHYLVAFVNKHNKKAAGNLRKLGLRRSERLRKIAEKEFYGEYNPHEEESKYSLFAVKLKK